ncbi:MAG TPA: pyridoxal 5'-phosphate synthase glutaminase subunit PdxT [Thermoplasmatales archaeon]|nr:pyridoxal 5'-phosphate synthase glutaminase subunit PdxT [Thermoplasmatales archaeon]
MVTVGVVALQGDVSEHVYALERAFGRFGIDGKVILIRKREDVENVDGIVIPGGESTTISRVMGKEKISQMIIERYENDHIPILGTCAGCVLLAKEIEDNDGRVKPLSLMDMKVRRNAFGRQRESFEVEVEVEGFSTPYRAVFIRAPAIIEVKNRCEIVARFGDVIVGAKQDSLIALSFHPELTDDLRFHEMFLDLF